MRVTLVHNPVAGTAEPSHAIARALEDIGWSVARTIPKDALDDALAQPEEVFVVAGGDGTVGKVAKRLAGTDRAMAIVPTGTANNVARSLGLGVDAMAAVAGLANAVERSVDLGHACTEDRREPFLESFGAGAFAHVIGERASHEDKKLDRAVDLLAREIERHAPARYEIEADGRDASGAYVLVAVMNVRSLGPALGVAPAAECDDGELDLVLVPPELRASVAEHLRRANTHRGVPLPPLAGMRVQHVRVKSDARWAHVDDDARELRGEVRIDVARGMVRVLVPALFI